MSASKPWLSGEPYYCALCGAGGAERMACEMPDCKLESREEAQTRLKTRKAIIDILHRYRRGEIKLADDAASEIAAEIARTLDRHSAAQRESDAKIADEEAGRTMREARDVLRPVLKLTNCAMYAMEQATVAVALALGRRAAAQMEEAARICDERAAANVRDECFREANSCRACAAAIRSAR